MKRASTILAAAIICCLIRTPCAQLAFSSNYSKQTVSNNLKSQLLTFTENRAQWGDKTLFKAESGGAVFYFCRDEVAYLFTRDTDQLLNDDHLPLDDLSDFPSKFNHPRYKKEALLIKAQFVDANPVPEVIGENRLSHNCNYFYGNDPSKWCTDVPNYSSITYKDIYPGIDLKYHGDSQGIKYDFIINPGADILQIKIRYEGVDNLTISDTGDLQAETKFGLIHENIPLIFQRDGRNRREIEGRYIMLEPGVFGFALDGGYNPSLPLVIDPELVYSSFLGGTSNDEGFDIALDNEGCAYVTGYTWSSNFPAVNPYDAGANGQSDVFVTKIAAGGGSIAYSTYIGGSDIDWAYGITVDNHGSSYITGYTASTDFPMSNPYDETSNGQDDAFVIKLTSSGDTLVYSTYLGGNLDDTGFDIAVDSLSCAYITGTAESYNFPTAYPYNGDHNALKDVFLTKLNPAGDSLIYSTYLGGDGDDIGYGMALDASGSVYITGQTSSIDFPLVNPYDNDWSLVPCVFVTKFTPSGRNLNYSTYIGGSFGIDCGYGIVVDTSGSAYITGYTYSPDFPMVNAYDDECDGWICAFVTKLSHGGSSLIYSTFLGGSIFDTEGYAIAVDDAGHAFVTGVTSCRDFPLVAPYDSDSEFWECFVSVFSSPGRSLTFSSYLGGVDADWGNGIVSDGLGGVYITGWTASPDFPILNPFDNTSNGAGDAFITKFDFTTGIDGDSNQLPRQTALDALTKLCQG